MGRGLALILVLPLGCCVQEDLASCLSTGEQMIRLKQLTLGAEQQESFNSCLRKWGSPENYCRAMYLNADGIARDCMKGRGYTFSDRDRGGENAVPRLIMGKLSVISRRGMSPPSNIFRCPRRGRIGHEALVM